MESENINVSGVGVRGRKREITRSKLR